MGKTAYIGVGSNLGNKLSNCHKAIELIEGISGCRVIAQSGFYHTEPFGVEDQDWYVNAVIFLATELSSQDLLGKLLAIETDMGRRREKRWDPRVIDLDILLFGQDVIQDENLRVPHPLMHLRRFVLAPLVELAPDLIHPVLGVTMAELLNSCSEEGQAVMAMAGA